MKNNEEYLQAKEVIKNPKDYEQQMVYDAQNFIRGYEAALSISVSKCFGKSDLQYVYENVDTSFKNFEDWYADYILPI